MRSIQSGGRGPGFQLREIGGDRHSVLPTADVHVPVLIGVGHHPRHEDASGEDDQQMFIHCLCGADAPMSAKGFEVAASSRNRFSKCRL
jgi:hypothetical protein